MHFNKIYIMIAYIICSRLSDNIIIVISDINYNNGTKFESNIAII